MRMSSWVFVGLGRRGWKGKEDRSETELGIKF